MQNLFSKIILLIFLLFIPFVGYAETTHLRGKIIQASPVEKIKIEGTNRESFIQSVVVHLKEENKNVTIENDLVPLKKGDHVFLNRLENGEDYIYILSTFDRSPLIIILLAIFVTLIIFFGKYKGLRGLISLSLGIFVITYLFIPGILKGISPLFLSILISILLIGVISFITHGYNKVTWTAVFGMTISMIVTGVLSFITIKLGNFTGLGTEESTYLSVVNGDINMSGLLLGGIMIGLVGVLYDAAIAQSATVQAIYNAQNERNRKVAFDEASKVGRTHIGALVDTLAIAYIGAALPLLLLISAEKTEPILVVLNHEMFATEIIRILLGSIGLLLSVPITTWLATRMLVKDTTYKNTHTH